MTLDTILERQGPDADTPWPTRRAIIEEARRVRRQFLIMLRENAPASTRPAALTTSLRPGTHPGLSQEAVAEKMTISTRTYRKLEAGEASWSEDTLRLFEKAVGLVEREDEQAASTRQVLWNLTIGRTPRGLSAPAISTADRLHIDSQKIPSYLSNDWWEMVYRNEAMAEWFPALVPGANIMTWCMSEEGSRYLLDWEETWVRPMLAQLRAAYFSSLNGNTALAERLAAVLAEVLAYEPVRRYWEEDQFTIYVGPNGNIRRMLHPTQGEKTILLWSALALGTSNTRVMHVYELAVGAAGVLEPVKPEC